MEDKSERLSRQIDIVYGDARLISKWFDTTAAMIEEYVHPETRADMICVTAMTVGATYSNACIDLLKLGYHMPVKALLRILCELTAKLAWCLVTPKTKSKRMNEAIEKKIMKWEKYSVHKNLVIMKEFRSIVSEDQREELEESILKERRKLDQLHCQRMPKTIEIFNKISKKWRTVIYPHGFLQFNSAVHIDLGSLAGRISKNGSEIMVDFDSAEDVAELSGYCLSFMYQIISLVRRHFGWDNAEMDREFHENNRNQ